MSKTQSLRSAAISTLVFACLCAPEVSAGYDGNSPRVIPTTLRGNIIFSRSGDLWALDPEDGSERLVLKQPFWKDPVGITGELFFSNDFSRVFFTHTPRVESPRRYTGNELLSMRLDKTSKLRLTDTGWMQFCLTPILSPDGRKIVYTRHTGYRMGGPGFAGSEIRIVNTNGSDDRRLIGDIRQRGDGYVDAFWRRDGRRLMFTYWPINLDYRYGYDVEPILKSCSIDGRDVRAFKGNYGDFLRPDVSPDGKWRAVVENLGKTVGIVIRNIAKYNDPPRAIADNNYLHVMNQSWSGDGRRVAFNGERVATIDDETLPFQTRELGIWVVSIDDGSITKIASDAQLIGWIH